MNGIERDDWSDKDPASGLSARTAESPRPEAHAVRLTREETLYVLNLCASAESGIAPFEEALFQKIREHLDRLPGDSGR